MKEDMFEAMMETTGDSIVYADLKGRYIEVSRKKAENWGRTREEMKGLTDFDLMSEEEATQARQDSLHVINTGESLINCRREAIRNGKLVYYSLSEQPWFYKNDTISDMIIGTISISRDITESVEQEKRIINMYQQILNMVKIVSHDLSAPLTNISALAKQSMRGYFGEEGSRFLLDLNPYVADAFKEIYNRSLKLRGAISDYLHSFSNLTEGQDIEKEHIDVRVVIDEVVEELDELIRDNKSIIDFTLGEIPYDTVIVFANKAQLKIVYRNLIINALKHGGEGCIISFGYQDWKNLFALNVYNDGHSVPEDEIPFLFEPFVQGKKVEKGNGLGIGLCTIRNMLRNVGGDMWYETTLSGHPNFVFTVPKSKME